MDDYSEILNSPWSKATFALIFTLVVSIFYERQFLRHRGEGAEAVSHREIIRTAGVFLGKKMAGFFFFAMLPAVIFILVFYKSFEGWMGGIPETGDWVLIFVCFIAASVAGYLGSKQDHVREQYPQMRIRHWNFFHLLISLTGWFVYLVGYEFLFRGMLLHLCIPVMGVPMAIAVNVLLYSALHWKKSIREALGAIPFGVLLCLLTLYTGSLLAPIVVHFGLSMSTEIFSIHHNPKMKFV